MSNSDNLHSNSLEELRQMGASFAESGQLDQAIECYVQALPLSQSAEDGQAEDEILKALGGLYQRVGQPQQAMDYLNKGLSLVRKYEKTQPLRIADYLQSLADCEEASRNYSGAAEYLRETLSIFETQRCPIEEQVYVTLRLAGLYTLAGDELTASIPYQQAVAKAQQAGSAELEAQALYGLGMVCLHQNQLDNAKHYLEMALAAATKGGSAAQAGQVLKQLGVTLLALQRNGEAAFAFQRALDWLHTADEADLQADVKTLLQSTYPAVTSSTSVKEIEQQLAQARQAGSGLVPALLAELAARYLEQGQYPKVIESYDDAIKLSHAAGDRHAEMTWLTYLGNFYAGHYESYKALQAYEAALGLSRQVGDALLEGQLLLNLGLTYADQERMVEAKKLIKEAQRLFEQLGEGDLAAQAREYHNSLG